MPGRVGPVLLARITLLLAVCLAGTLAGYGGARRASAGGLSPETTTLAFPPPPILAGAAAVMDADSGQWIYLANADQPLPMASTTKIMTAILAIEHGHLDDLVPVSRAAATVGESTMGLVRGERVRMLDLLYGLMLPSGNDAAIAIAEHVAGSQRAFVRLMNARAAALHLTHTHYTNPYGFSNTPDGDDPSHHTSARDLALLARYAMRSPLFRRIVATKHYHVARTSHNLAHDLTSVNLVLFWYPGADGVKPGWTSGAGFCQVVDAHRFGKHLLAVVLHTPNLYTDVRDLLDYGFGNFSWVASGLAGDSVDQVIEDSIAGVPGAYFPYTGHRVYGAFRAYFRRHGGLAVFGFPRTEPIDVDGDVEQFFTNQVLSLDPQTNVVTALRLGFAAVPGQSWLARVPRLPDTSWRTYYPQTGHTVTYRFRAFYLANGGPATFGYPITEKQFLGKTLVQYFENTEFIWHPTSATDGYIAMAPFGEERLVQLGLLPSQNNLSTVPTPPSTPQPSPTATTPPSPTPRPIATLKVVTPRVPTATATPFPTVVATQTTTPLPTGTATALPPTSIPTIAPPSPTAAPIGTDTPVPPVTLQR